MIGKQLTAGQFLDGIAIVNIVPTPLVMFITWVRTGPPSARGAPAPASGGGGGPRAQDGFMASGVVGAVLMTIGMFLPSFSFVARSHAAAAGPGCGGGAREPHGRLARAQVIFHRLFMWLTDTPAFGAFIDGVSATVIGIIAETVFQLIQAGVHTGMDTLIFTVCLGFIHTSTNKFAPVMVLIAAAMAGQIIYAPNAQGVILNALGPPPPFSSPPPPLPPIG